MTTDRWPVVLLAATGLASGFFSGLFGIGGGLIIVPALVAVLGIDHKRAVGTSLLAILPAIISSTISYAVGGTLDLAAGALLALGAVGGAQFGARLLHWMPLRLAQWLFVGFVAMMVAQLLLVVPVRGHGLSLDLGSGAGLVALGVGAGVLSAILGIGGGGIAVPVLMFAFGAGDLVAKGASLLMMAPGVASGLAANLRLRNVDVRVGVIVGLASLVTSPFGAWVAHMISAQLGSWLFAAFLAFIGVTVARQAIRTQRPPEESGHQER